MYFCSLNVFGLSVCFFMRLLRYIDYIFTFFADKHCEMCGDSLEMDYVKNVQRVEFSILFAFNMKEILSSNICMDW